MWLLQPFWIRKQMPAILNSYMKTSKLKNIWVYKHHCALNCGYIMFRCDIFRLIFKSTEPTARTTSRHCLVFVFFNNTISLRAVSHTGSVFVLMLLDYVLQTNIKHISTETANSLLPVPQKLAVCVFPPLQLLSPLRASGPSAWDNHLKHTQTHKLSTCSTFYEWRTDLMFY